MFNNKDKVAIWMEGSLDDDYGKMGISAMRYLENEIVCVIDSTHSGKVVSEVSPIIKKNILIVDSLEKAKSMGASVLLLGVLTSGGVLPDHWEGTIIKALKLGLSLINGLHVNLNDKYSSYIVDKANQWIWDTRTLQFIPKIGSGETLNLNNKRVLMIGTDMASGKMTTGLELYSYLKKKSINVGFVATGQIGIMLTGKGIPLDAYKLDYACGAVQHAVMEEKDKDVVIVEGQGSILHPGSAATLPLMRGTCPTHMILCHLAHNNKLRSPEWVKVPNLLSFIKLNEELANVLGTYANSKVVGVSLNTSRLNDNEAKNYISKVEKETGLPAADVIRFGGEKIFEKIIE